jgi:uncharacterized protein
MSNFQLAPDSISFPHGISVSAEALNQLCQQWQITELALFGSVLRADFNPSSDIDFLVTFSESAKITFFDLDAIEQRLSQIVGRSVDVVTRRAIEQSHNPIRRQNILGNARIIYEQR